MQVEITGARELRAHLRRLGRWAVVEYKAIHVEAGELVAEEARRLVPRRTGALSASIRARKLQAGARISAGSAKRVSYAGPVHFGWPSRPNRERRWRGGPIRPNPFLYDAIDKRRADVIALYERRLKELPVFREYGAR